MGSTGEPDRKRRHFSSLSSPTAAATKKSPFVTLSEDKKVFVLLFPKFFMGLFWNYMYIVVWLC